MQQIIARILLLGLLLARISSQYVSSITLQGIVILLSSRFFCFRIFQCPKLCEIDTNS